MAATELNVVTGAFSFSGRFITERLLAQGKAVRTLTGHPEREHPFGSQVGIAPLDFDNHYALVASLRGATTLYNTYWIRFPRGRITFDTAVENTKKLLRAAAEAGVHRVVHLSVTNPSAESPLPYFRGKALTEQAVIDSGLSYAILRPALIFGPGDVLINNIAWLLRRFPVFVILGAGDYRVQPVFVGDIAEIAVAAGQRDDNFTVDVVGPETFTFNELVHLIADCVGSYAGTVHLPPGVVLFLARLIGYMTGDVVLTRNEVAGLTANLLVSDSEPNGVVALSQWLRDNAASVGIKYASELTRHYR